MTEIIITPDNCQEIVDAIKVNAAMDVVERNLRSARELDADFKKGKVKLGIIFPANFEEDLLHTNKATVQIIADASDPNQATMVSNYVTQIINDYNLSMAAMQPLQITAEMRMLYNPELKGSTNFVPGVMALVLMLVCTMMTSAAIVKEKEMGTMEVLLVSPFKPRDIIVSKLTPYLLISIMNLGIILILSVTFLDLEIRGSLILLI